MRRSICSDPDCSVRLKSSSSSIKHVLDARGVGNQIAVVRPHALDDRVDQVGQKRAVDTQAAAIPDRAAHDAPQDVLTAARAGTTPSRTRNVIPRA